MNPDVFSSHEKFSNFLEWGGYSHLILAVGDNDPLLIGSLQELTKTRYVTRNRYGLYQVYEINKPGITKSTSSIWQENKTIYNFVNHLEKATFTGQDKRNGWLFPGEPSRKNIRLSKTGKFNPSQGILMYPSTSISYTLTLPKNDNIRLEGILAVIPDIRNRPTDTVIAAINLKLDGTSHNLFQTRLNSSKNSHDISISLREYAGKNIDISFEILTTSKNQHGIEIQPIWLDTKITAPLHNH